MRTPAQSEPNEGSRLTCGAKLNYPMRFLYIQPSLVPPSTDLRADRFYLLSETMGVDVLQPLWMARPEQVEELYGPGSYPVYKVGNCRYHWFLAFQHQGLRQRLAIWWFYIRTALRLHRETPLQCVVAYSHMASGVIGTIVKALTGAKLIVEIVTTPSLVAITERPKPTLGDRLKKRYSDLCLHLSVLSCDRVRLLFEGQLAPYRLLRHKPRSVFHEFSPVSLLRRGSVEVEITKRTHEELFILLIGAPWFLKGADLLIEAYRRLLPEFPELRLKLLGYYPDRAGLDALVADLPQVEILKARPNPEAMEIMRQATIFALPTRCEGMPRVVVEALSMGIPVVTSDVGGLPAYIRHGENGFLFPAGDTDALEDRLRDLLRNPDKRRRFQEAGEAFVHTHLTEALYVEQFTEMVKTVVEDSPTR